MGIDFTVVDPLPGTDRLEIAAGRVKLRRFTRGDLEHRCTWPPYDEPVFGHLNLRLDTPRQRDAWFQREWTVRQPFWFAVEDETGRLIGSITLRDVSRWRRTSRLGIHLHPKRLSVGYGTEALRLLMDYYFNVLRYRLLKLDVAAHNKRAIRCYEKLGFKLMFEFWRPNVSGIQWLKDRRFEHLRQYVRRRRGIEQIRHLEMHLDAKTNRRMRMEKQGDTFDTGSPRTRPAGEDGDEGI